MSPEPTSADAPSPTPPSVYFLTLGCPKNEVDSDRMKAAVLARGYSVIDDAEKADFAVVNTCSFIQEAAEESIETILQVASSWLPAREGRRLIVAGCLPSRYGRDLAEAMPEVDAFLPVAEEAALTDVLGRLGGGGMSSTPRGALRAHADGPAESTLSCPPRTLGAPSAYLQISDGCHRRCSYCTIPAIRGPYRSRPLEEIVAEALMLVEGGTREIVLVGQDISAYGRDLEQWTASRRPQLADVVRALAQVEDLAWLRLMYVQPDGVTSELLEAMSAEPTVCHYLDMPLQHASQTVLRAMQRHGSGAEFLELIGRVRSVMPDVVLRTSLIAGFPGETPADASELLEFVKEARIDYAGVFPYSPEDGTPAASMPDLPPKRTRRARAQRLRDAADRIGYEKASQMIGRSVEVLVEGIDDEGAIVGRWRGQAPEVDGIVVLDAGSPGDILRGRVVDSLGYDLVAEVI